MKKCYLGFRFNAILAVTIIGLTANLSADDPDKLPTAETVMNKYVEASGGKEKLMGIKSIMMSGKFQVVGQGVEGKLETVLVTPNKSYTKVDLGAAAGSQSVVFDGNIGWDISTVMGPRLLEGSEKERVIDQANLQRMYDPNAFYKSIKVLGMEDVDGEKTYKVTTETKDGFKTTEFYSVKTGLPVASQAVMPTAMGDMPAKTKYLEYKKVDGITLPCKIEMKISFGGFVQSFDKIEINKEVKKSYFEIPAEVQNIIKNTGG